MLCCAYCAHFFPRLPRCEWKSCETRKYVFVKLIKKSCFDEFGTENLSCLPSWPDYCVANFRCRAWGILIKFHMFLVLGEIKIVCASEWASMCVSEYAASSHTHWHALGLGNYNSSSFPLCAHVENKAKKGNKKSVCEAAPGPQKMCARQAVDGGMRAV